MLTDGQFFDALRQGLWTAVLMSLPILTAALVTGLAIGLFQALTSIQEMTLTFVPKIAAIFVVLLLATPLIYSTVKGLSDKVFDLIASGTV